MELEDFMEYCESMSKNMEWADHVIVVTMARMLEQNIIIVTSSPETDKDDSLVWVDGGEGCNEKLPLLVGHYWEYHYQSLQPKESLKTSQNREEEMMIDFKEQNMIDHTNDQNTHQCDGLPTRKINKKFVRCKDGLTPGCHYMVLGLYGLKKRMIFDGENFVEPTADNDGANKS